LVAVGIAPLEVGGLRRILARTRHRVGDYRPGRRRAGTHHLTAMDAADRGPALRHARRLAARRARSRCSFTMKTPNEELSQHLHYFTQLQHAADELREAATRRNERSWARASARGQVARHWTRLRYMLAYHRYERARLRFLKAITH